MRTVILESTKTPCPSCGCDVVGAVNNLVAVTETIKYRLNDRDMNELLTIVNDYCEKKHVKYIDKLAERSQVNDIFRTFGIARKSKAH